MAIEEAALNMCRKFLSAKDLNDICRYRRFKNPPKEKERLAEFVARRLPGKEGIQEAIASLDDKGKIFLFLLSFARDEKTVRNLRLSVGKVDRGGNIDEKTALAELTSHLVNRGLVILEDTNYREYASESRFARFRLSLLDHVSLPAFPAEFAELGLEVPEDCHDTFWRQALQSAFGGKTAKAGNGPLLNEVTRRLSIISDRLCLKDEPLDTGESLQGRLLSLWTDCHAAHMSSPRKGGRHSYEIVHDETFVVARQILSTAPPECGLTASGLQKALEKLGTSFDKVDRAKSFLEDGYQSGLLRKGRKGSEQIYRLAEHPSINSQDENADLKLTDLPKGICVDLNGTAVSALLSMARVCRVSCENHNLLLHPDLQKMVQAKSEGHQLYWRKASSMSKIFASACESVESKHGKLLFHENVLVMRIEDVGLRALIKHKFVDAVREIDEPYMVAPHALADDIEALVRKQGYSVRR